MSSGQRIIHRVLEQRLLCANFCRSFPALPQEPCNRDRCMITSRISHLIAVRQTQYKRKDDWMEKQKSSIFVCTTPSVQLKLFVFEVEQKKKKIFYSPSIILTHTHSLLSHFCLLLPLNLLSSILPLPFSLLLLTQISSLYSLLYNFFLNLYLALHL